MTLKFDGWPRKTIGHLFCTRPSFMHHFKSIGEFKLESQSLNSQFGSKLAIFCPEWPWNLMDDLKTNRAPFLYYVKFCASLQSHWCIQIVVTVCKLSIRVQIGDYLSRVTLNFDGWHRKIIWYLFYTTSSFVHHFKAISEFKLGLQSGNAHIQDKIGDFFCPVWPWNMTDDLGKH